MDCSTCANLHRDRGAMRLSTCLTRDNGHRCSLAKCTANKDQMTILARKPVDDKQVCEDTSLEAGKDCDEGLRESQRTFTTNTLPNNNLQILPQWFLIYTCIQTKSWPYTHIWSDTLGWISLLEAVYGSFIYHFIWASIRMYTCVSNVLIS